MASMSTGVLARKSEARVAPQTTSVIITTILTSSEMEKSGLSELMRERVQRLRTNASRTLSAEDRRWLELLVKKTTNNKRKHAFLSSDTRGLHGYLKHADLENFPKRLCKYAYLTNASINTILRMHTG